MLGETVGKPTTRRHGTLIYSELYVSTQRWSCTEAGEAFASPEAVVRGMTMCVCYSGARCTVMVIG